MISFTNPRAQSALKRAVIISLFSWRKAHDDDEVDGSRYGYWGDSYPPVPGALIGSRLWLLKRSKIVTNETLMLAEEIIREALQWFIDDQIAREIQIQLERSGIGTIKGVVTLFLTEGGTLSVPFNDIWQVEHAL
nr:MAG TPA: hypothetical protein [Caudoviricetes sp.]